HPARRPPDRSAASAVQPDRRARPRGRMARRLTAACRGVGIPVAGAQPAVAAARRLGPLAPPAPPPDRPLPRARPRAATIQLRGGPRGAGSPRLARPPLTRPDTRGTSALDRFRPPPVPDRDGRLPSGSRAEASPARDAGTVPARGNPCHPRADARG